MGMDRKIEQSKWSRKRLTRIGGVVALVCLLVYVFLISDSSSRLNVETGRLQISTVENGAFQFYIPLLGSVLPIKTYYLDAVEGGRVEAVVREAGSFVEKGDTILYLANTNLRLDIMNREASLFEQRNNLRNTRLAMQQNSLRLEAQLVELDYQVTSAERLFNRNAELVKRKLISQDEFEESRDRFNYLIKNRDLTIETQRQDSVFRSLQIEMLEQSVDRIQANLEFVRQNEENLYLRAPVSGHLTSLNAEIGESKTRGQRLGQIDILDGYKVRADVDELYVTRLNVGMRGDFDLTGNTYRLEVTKIYPEIRDGRFEVDLEFVGEAPEGVRRGQTVHVRLELDDLTEAVLLPRGSFYQSTGGNWAFVVNEDGGFATRRDIRLGRKNPEYFEVLEGLEPGDRVVISSYENFGDNDKLILNE